MATVDIARKKARPKYQADAPPPPKRRRRVFRWLFLLTVIGLGVGLYFAPMVAINTALADWLIEALVPIDGTIAFESATLDWFQPVSVSNLQVRDADGEEVLFVESITSDQPLVAMVLNLADLGRLHVTRPTLHIVAGEHETNLERVLRPVFATSGKTDVRAQVDVTEGRLVIDDDVARRTIRFEDLALECNLPDPAGGISLSASGRAVDDQQPGSFKVELAVSDRAATADEDAVSLANGRIDFEASSLPLKLLEPIVRRWLGSAELGGLLSAKLRGAWGTMAEHGDRTVSGDASIADFDLTAAALNDDHIHLKHVAIPCRVVQDNEWVQIEQLGINTEVGELSVVASVKLADLSASDRLAALARESCEVKGNLDLAQLATMLPSTLRLRSGTELTSGQIKLSAATRPQGDATQWTAQVTTSPLSAKVDGHVFSWDNPLSIDLAASESADGFLVERIDCSSSFIEASARGTLDDWTASADFDLARLVAELKKFRDVGQLQLAGHGQAQLVWKRMGSTAWSSRGEFQARGFQWITGQARPWTENNLIVTVDARGKLAEGKLHGIDQAQLTLTAGKERAEVSLREAVADPGAATWPLECSWTGELAHWAPRIESCLGLADWDLAGQGTLTAKLLASRSKIEFSDCHADFTHVEIHGHGHDISEPAAELVADGKFDMVESSIELVRAEASAGASSADISHVVFSRGANGFSLRADAKLTADLGQVARWLKDSHNPSRLQVSGKLTGEAHLKQQEGATSGQLDGAIDRLHIVEHAGSGVPDASGAAWEEKHLPFAARVSYSPSAEQLTIEKLQLVGEALRCDAAGTLGTSGEGARVDLKGTLQYDWEQLAPLWQSQLGPHVQIAGKQVREFTVRGPLTGPVTSLDSYREVSADASIGWSSMDVYGLAVGRADVRVQMADGQVRTAPIDVAVSEGRLTVAPLVRLSAKPADVVLERGPMLTNVHLSRELCQRGLRFITPVLADSTVADGRFSISLDGGRFPLLDPTAGDISGHLAMQAQARPGPIARQFLVLIKELTSVLQRGKLDALSDETGALVSVNENDIQFRCVNRRVYHRGLRFTIGTTPITTYGWVAFDETLAIVAEVPLQAKLFGVDLSLGTLEGQVLQIPINGTLDDPQLDKRALTQLTGRMLENTARGVLLDGVEKQLERLLPGKP